MKLKLFTDRNFLPPKTAHVVLLYPFWGNLDTDSEDPDYGRFDDYCNTGKSIFELTDASNCDAFLLPFDFSFQDDKLKLTTEFTSLAKLFNKKIIVFYNSDDDRILPLDTNAIIFRTSFYQNTKTKNEFAFPGWSLDFLGVDTRNFQGIPKSVRPAVSYCGYIDYENLKEEIALKIALFRGKKKEEIGPKLRGEIIRKLSIDKRIKTNFIIRKGFWAHGISDKKAARKEYIKNMLSSEYAVVTRGGGNFSYRLYEVISCGRIPVFVNTDCVLPYPDFIEWKKICVWVEADEIKNIAQKIIDFHTQISSDEFIALQKQLRDVYEKWLCPSGFYAHLHTCIYGN